MKIAFDIDDTLWKIVRYIDDKGHKAGRQVPDYDLIQVLRWFYNNGDEVFIWSAGGMDYAKTIAEKLGLIDMVTIIPKMHTDKEGKGTGMPLMDIAFDDCESRLAKVDIRVKRDYSNPEAKVVITTNECLKTMDDGF